MSSHSIQSDIHDVYQISRRLHQFTVKDSILLDWVKEIEIAHDTLGSLVKRAKKIQREKDND